MDIEVEVKVKNTKRNSDLYSLFCSAYRGDFVDTSNSGTDLEVKSLDNTLSIAFDEFAQKMFDEGRKYEKLNQGDSK